MLSLGSVVHNRYRIDRLLEIGALEARYRGWDQDLGEPIFIRELSPQPDLTQEEEDTLRSAFLMEAASIINLQHPHIARVLAAFVQPDASPAPDQATWRAYLVQQSLAGQPLSELITREGAIKERRVVAYAKDLLDALAYAHEHGVIHRDIRPESVLITPDDHALLTNFEIVALWSPGDPRTWTAKRVLGVPQYAPPECWGMHTSQVDARSDIYSLGATLYHAITGEQPLTAGERTSNPYQFLQVKALAPRVNSRTRSVILQAMELPLDKRHQTAASMLRALEAQPLHEDSRLPAPAPFLPKRPQFAWSRVWGLLLSTLVLFLASLLGLWLNQTYDLPTLVSRAGPTDDELALVAAELTPAASLTTTPRAEPAVEASPVLPTLEVPQTATTRLPEVGTMPVPSPPEGWRTIITDNFDDNANGWVVSEFEDEWGSTRRAIEAGSYHWEIDAAQAVSRWCTPDLSGGQAFPADYMVSVEVQRLSGPESAAYGLVLRHTEGSYYLFSVRDDGYFLLSLWDGAAWQPIVDWTQTMAVKEGEVNRLSARAEGASFELYINDALVHQAQSDLLREGEAGLSISTAATDSPAVFQFDNFSVWAP